MHLFHLNRTDRLVAYHRWGQGGPRDDVIVLANCANRAYDAYTIGLPRDGRWRVRFNSDWTGYDPDFAGHPSDDLDARPEPRDGLAFSGDVGLGAYSAIVLSQDS
jgi:1,4-alpha-glucan branching enzyme